MYLPMKISSERQKGIEIVEEGFLDCGATGKFIDQNYTKDKGLKTEPLKEPIKVYNVDGTLNKLLRFFFFSSAHVFLMSDCRFTPSLFHPSDRFRSMFHHHAFYLHMFTVCILMHVFHTCHTHVYLLLIYYMPCKHGLFVYKLVCRLSCFFS